MRSRVQYLLVLAICLCGQLAIAQSFRGFPPPVREHGDMQRVQFEGELTVSPQDLRNELESSLDVIKASRQSMQLSRLMEVMDHELLRGFLASGFPDAAVATRLDETQGYLVVTINEGPHFKCGEIVVEGVSDDRAAYVRENLTQQATPATVPQTSQPPKKPEVKVELNKEQYARWFPDHPCDFSAGRLTQLQKAAVTVLEEAGLYGPNAVVTLKRDPEKGVVELLVNPGPRSDPQIVADINTTGSLLHQPADIIALLELRSGMTWSPKRLREIEQKLYECGRFIDWKVSTDPGIPNGNTLHVNLELVENLHAPLLTEELSDAAQVFLRTSQSWRHWEQYGEDLSVEFRTDSFKELVYQFSATSIQHAPAVPVRISAIASADGGSLFGFEIEGPQPFGYRVITHEGRVRLDSLHRKVSVQTDSLLDSESVIQGEVFVDKRQDAEKWTSLKFNVGFRGGIKPKGRAIAELSMTPGFAISDSSDQDNVVGFTDGPRLIVYSREQGEDCRLEFDVETGRFLGCLRKPDDFAPVYLKAAMEPRAFEMACNSIELDGWSVTKNAQVGDVLEFIGIELKSLPAFENVAEVEKALRWLSLLSHLSQRLTSDQSVENAVGFHIPTDSQQQAPTAFIAAILAKVNGMAFARQSLLRQFGQEISLLLSTSDQRSIQEMVRMLRHQDAGPLLDLYATEVIALINPPGARDCALRGLRVIDDQDMSTELAAIFGDETKLGQMLVAAVNHMRQLPVEERALLLEIFPEDSRAALEAHFANAEMPAETVVLQTAQIAWNTWGRELVRKRLLQHAPPIQQTGG